MNIVFASHSAFDPNLVVGSHHLARACAYQGHRVLHLSSPVTSLHGLKCADPRTRTRLQRACRGARQVQQRLWEWIPFSPVPWQVATRFGLDRKNLFVPSPRSIRRALRVAGMGHVDLLLVDEPRLVGIEQILRPTRMAYRATDLYAEMKNDATIGRAEAMICCRADAIFATSAPVADHLQRLAGRDVSIVPNGVDLRHLRQPVDEHKTLSHIPRPRAVYVGAVDFRFDMRLIERLAAEHPDVSFLIYGPLSITPPAARTNVHCLGPLRYDELPAVLQHCDIGLLPMNDHPANNGRSPMKFYEYVAAGLPVLSRATDEINRRSEAGILEVYENPSEASRLLLELKNRDVELPRIEEHGWTHKANCMIEELQNSQVDRPSWQTSAEGLAPAAAQGVEQ